MKYNMQNINSPKRQFKNIVAGYIYPVLPLSGFLILSGLIFTHIFRTGASLSINEKILNLSFILIAGIFILGGTWVRTKHGVRIFAKFLKISEDSMLLTRKNFDFQILEYLVIFWAFSSIFLFSVDTKIAVYNLDAARYFNDTPSYIETGSYSLLDGNFWVGYRPFTLPLFYKMVGYTLQNYTDQGEMEQVARIQLVISIITWTLLAISTSFLMKKWILRFLSFTVMTMIGASLYVTMWDRLMLSESLSMSLFVLLLALLIFLGRIWRINQALSVWFRIVLLIFAIVIAALYSFTRDTNAYFLLSLGGIMVLGLLFRSIRKHKYLVYYVVIIISFISIFGIQNTIINKTSVHVLPLRDVFIYRFFPDKEKLAYLMENGMPYDQRYSSYIQLNLRQVTDQLLVDDPAGLFSNWIKNHGKKVLFAYMLSHPDYTFIAPLADLQPLVNGSVSEYRKILTPTPLRLSFLTAIFYSKFSILPIIYILFFGILIFLAFKNQPSRFIAILILTLFITAVPTLLLVWSSDPNDIPRHALQAALQLRLASWLCILLLIEYLWEFLTKIWITKNNNPTAETLPG